MDAAHRRPPGMDDDTVAALGKLSEALETTERARGHLYAVHQLTGHADLQLGDAVDLLRKAGHDALFKALALGRRHIHEAAMKQRRRTHGLPGHEGEPAEVAQ